MSDPSLRVECPYCGASIKRRCIVGTGYPWRRTVQTHMARLRAARQKKPILCADADVLQKQCERREAQYRSNKVMR